jgi:hypothetical protein
MQRLYIAREPAIDLPIFRDGAVNGLPGARESVAGLPAMAPSVGTAVARIAMTVALSTALFRFMGSALFIETTDLIETTGGHAGGREAGATRTTTTKERRDRA